MKRFPLHDKLKKHAAEVKTIGKFLVWLSGRNFEIVERTGRGLVPLNVSDESIVHAFLGIKGAKLEAERRKMRPSND